MSELAVFRQLDTRVVGGGSVLLQHLSEKVASLVHAFCGGSVLGDVDVNRLAADRAIVLCL